MDLFDEKLGPFKLEHRTRAAHLFGEIRLGAAMVDDFIERGDVAGLSNAVTRAVTEVLGRDLGAAFGRLKQTRGGMIIEISLRQGVQQ